LKDLIKYLARSPFDWFNEVTVTLSSNEKTLLLLTVAEEDQNRFIVKDSQAIKVMRALLTITVAREGSRYFLKIIFNTIKAAVSAKITIGILVVVIDDGNR